MLTRRTAVVGEGVLGEVALGEVREATPTPYASIHQQLFLSK
jgi:hypothetical protein